MAIPWDVYGKFAKVAFEGLLAFAVAGVASGVGDILIFGVAQVLSHFGLQGTIARDYLLREGLPPDLVIKTGSPMFEVLTHYRPRIDASDVLARLVLVADGYFVVSAHREENIESEQSFTKLVAVLNAVAEDYGLPVIVSTHPRTQKGFVALVESGRKELLRWPGDQAARL